MSSTPLLERVRERVRDWGVVVKDTLETQGSFVAFGTRGDLPVVLKVLRQPGDEWRSGEVLEAFGGRGTVRVYEHVGGAVLLERLRPGSSLSALALSGQDRQATEVIAEVIRRMSHQGECLTRFAAVEDWAKGFQRHLASGDNQIPIDLVEEARHIYLELCATQRDRRLLHGDLQHYNILFDRARGWTAIDPKGVVGEIEYEVGASLRNPGEKPELFACARAVEARLKVYERVLRLNTDRALRWAFAQAVLSAIWTVEDGFAVGDGEAGLLLAKVIGPMLK